MRCFLKNIGLLFIVAGAVLLVFYTTQNRIGNLHFMIAGACEVFGLIIYILSNRYIVAKKKDEHC